MLKELELLLELGKKLSLLKTLHSIVNNYPINDKDNLTKLEEALIDLKGYLNDKVDTLSDIATRGNDIMAVNELLESTGSAPDIMDDLIELRKELTQTLNSI